MREGDIFNLHPGISIRWSLRPYARYQQGSSVENSDLCPGKHCHYRMHLLAHQDLITIFCKVVTLFCWRYLLLVCLYNFRRCGVFCLGQSAFGSLRGGVTRWKLVGGRRRRFLHPTFWHVQENRHLRHLHSQQVRQSTLSSQCFHFSVISYEYKLTMVTW